MADNATLTRKFIHHEMQILNGIFHELLLFDCDFELAK